METQPAIDQQKVYASSLNMVPDMFTEELITFCVQAKSQQRSARGTGHDSCAFIRRQCDGLLNFVKLQANGYMLKPMMTMLDIRQDAPKLAIPNVA